MTSSLLFVFDTNTVVSALLVPDSKPRQTFMTRRLNNRLDLAVYHAEQEAKEKE
jgi:hypothetical protein